MSNTNEQLKKEWMSHTREAIEKKWYKCELSSGLYDDVWRQVTYPEFLCAADYRIVKTPNHPEYVEPPKMVKVEFETTKELANDLLNNILEQVNSSEVSSMQLVLLNKIISGLKKAAFC
jgi:hypothetical protein